MIERSNLRDCTHLVVRDRTQRVNGFHGIFRRGVHVCERKSHAQLSVRCVVAAVAVSLVVKIVQVVRAAFYIHTFLVVFVCVEVDLQRFDARGRVALLPAHGCIVR
jgi:hypothetical protein